MSALSIQPTFPIFTDTDGSPLENGYIWIGTVNQPAQTNPIAVYWDAALTITATQPIRTQGGYPSRNGSPARLYVNSDYSILVQNKNGSMVYSAPAATERIASSLITYTPGPNSLLTATTVQGALDQLSDDEDGSSYVGFLQAGNLAVPTTVQAKLRETVSVKDFGGTTGDVLTTVDAMVAGTPVGDYIVFECPPDTSVLPQDITGIKNCGKSITITHYENYGLLNSFQHNQGPYGTSGVPDNEWRYSATDNPGMVIESITRATDGTPINQNRADGNRRADKASNIHRLNIFSNLPKNVFQQYSIWQHENLTSGAEQPELDGTFFTSWFYDTNTSTYSTKNSIYIQNFAYGNSQVEANRNFANYLGYVGINTYDCKGFQHHIRSAKSASKASLISSAQTTIRQTFLNVTAASPDLQYNETQNGAYNFGFTYLTGGTYGRNYAFVRPGGLGASLGTDITNGTMFAFTTPDGNTYKSRTIQQQVELGTGPTTNNVFWTSGTGSPEGVVTGIVGCMYSRTDGGAGTTLYVKESGTGNTGWVAK